MKSIKYMGLFLLCFVFMISPVLIGGAIVSAYLVSNGNLNLPLCFGAFSVSLVLAGIGFAIRTALRNAREEKWAENIKRGKGKNYKRMSKQERQEVETQMAMQNESLLSSAEYKNILKRGAKKPEEELQGLVGLEGVKQKVLRYQAMIAGKSHPVSMHMCFLGNPGTGKTTVAAILTGFLYRYKYIRKNEYICIDGNFLKSSADPIARTNLLLSRAKGKVLFIDEAYAIVQGDTGMGQQILATLLNEMENQRDNMIVILAGYKKEMKALFNANSGLKSRINQYFLFDDYTMEEMKQIFTNFMHKENLAVSLDAWDRLESVLSKKKESHNFANARTVRNIAEKAIMEHEYNVKAKKIPSSDTYRIVAQDIVSEKKIDDYFA